MVFPVHAGRRIRLGCHAGPCVGQHGLEGSAAQADALGEPQRLLLVLDRTTGEFLLGKNFVKQNWNKGLTADGKPIKDPGHWPKPMGASLSNRGPKVARIGTRRRLVRGLVCSTSPHGRIPAASQPRATQVNGSKASGIGHWKRWHRSSFEKSSPTGQGAKQFQDRRRRIRRHPRHRSKNRRQRMGF